MPVRDTLELDLSQALTDIAEMGAGLSQITQVFKVGLAEAISSLADVPAVTITADTTTLTQSIDEAAAAASPTVDLSVDASAVTDEINAAEAQADTTVDVEAVVNADTSGLADEIDAAVSNIPPPPPIEITADTTEAQASIDDLGASSSNAAGGVGDLGTALGAASGAAVGAGEGVGGLTSSLSGAIGVAGPAAAAVAGLGLAADKYFDSATNAQAATLRFNNTFGDSAAAVNQVNFGGVSDSLANINLELGSSTSQVRNALSTFGTLGNQAGATGEQVQTAASQLAVLSQNAVALNPNLGSVGDVASKLDRLLGRGGPRLAQYGINLSAVDINAKAAEIALARGSGVVTEFDKRAAGAALATEKLGDAFHDNLEKAADNPIIQLKQLTAEFSKFTTALGQPLVTPIFDILHAAEPILEAVARLFGEAIQAALPFVQAIEHAFQPLITGILNAAGTIISSFIPVFQRSAGIIESLLAPALKSVDPLLQAIVTLFLAVAQAIGPVLDDIQPLAQEIGVLVGELVKLGATSFGGMITQLAELTNALAPFLEFLNPLALLSKGLQALGIIKSDTSGSDAFSQATQANVKDLADLQNQLIDADKNFASLQATQSTFSKNPAVLDQLRRTGISMGDLRTELEGADQGFKDFTARAITAGQVKVQIDGVDQTGDQIKGLDGTLTDYINTGKAVVVQGGELERSFAAQSAAQDQQAEANFRSIAAAKGLTDEQERAIGNTAKAVFGVDTYSTRLRVLAQNLDETSAKEKSASDQREENAQKSAAQAQGLSDLATQTLATGVTQDELKAKSEQLGISQDKLKAFTDGLTGAYNNFKQQLTAGLPEIQDTLSKVGDALSQGTNPQKLIDQLNNSTEALAEFQTNIQFLISNNFKALATVAAEKGPDFTNALVQSIKVGRPTLGAELNNNVQVFVDNIQKTKDFLTTTAAPQLFDASTAAGQAANAAFQQSVNFPGSVSVSMGGVPGAVASAQPGVNQAAAGAGTSATTSFGNALAPGDQVNGAFAVAQANITGLGLTGAPIMAAAGNAGGNIGVAFVTGLATTMGAGAEGDAPVAVAARKLIADADAIMRQAAGIHSPSTLTAGLGEQLGAGLAVGMIQSIPQVQAAAAQQIGAVTDVFNQRRNDGTIETVFDFADGSFIVSTLDGVDTAMSSLDGTAHQAANALAASRDQIDQYTVAAQSATTVTDGLAAAQLGLISRGPDDGLFAGRRTVQQIAGTTQTSASANGVNDFSKSITFTGPVQVTVPPGTKDPQAFGQLAAKGFMQGLDVEAIIS